MNSCSETVYFFKKASMKPSKCWIVGRASSLADRAHLFGRAVWPDRRCHPPSNPLAEPLGPPQRGGGSGGLPSPVASAHVQRTLPLSISTEMKPRLELHGLVVWTRYHPTVAIISCDRSHCCGLFPNLSQQKVIYTFHFVRVSAPPAVWPSVVVLGHWTETFPLTQECICEKSY